MTEEHSTGGAQPVEDETPSVPSRAIDGRRMSLLSLAVFDVGGPLAVYYGLRSAGSSSVVALVVSGVLPAVGIGLAARRHRRIDAVGVVVLSRPPRGPGPHRRPRRGSTGPPRAPPGRGQGARLGTPGRGSQAGAPQRGRPRLLPLPRAPARPRPPARRRRRRAGRGGGPLRPRPLKPEEPGALQGPLEARHGRRPRPASPTRSSLATPARGPAGLSSPSGALPHYHRRQPLLTFRDGAPNPSRRPGARHPLILLQIPSPATTPRSTLKTREADWPARHQALWPTHALPYPPQAEVATPKPPWHRARQHRPPLGPPRQNHPGAALGRPREKKKRLAKEQCLPGVPRKPTRPA